jgi:hypothetical protein
MKKALSIAAQFVLFLVVFLVGSFWNPLNAMWFLSHPMPGSTRFFVPTGLVAMVALYLLILLIEVGAKRLRTAGWGTTLAMVAALVLGVAGKFGFVTR